MITDYHAKYCAHELSIDAASDGVDRLCQSLLGGIIGLNSHQIGVALFVLSNLLSKDVSVVAFHWAGRITCILMHKKALGARAFYEIEAAKNNCWLRLLKHEGITAA